MARVERRLVATRTDRRLTLTEVAEFIRDAEAAGVDPGAWLKVDTNLRGHLRAIEIITDPSRQGLGSPAGGPTDEQ